MMEEEEKDKGEGDVPLEVLRIDHTDMSREEFVVHLGISMSTYRRWLSGKTSPKFTLEQIVSACRMCEIPLDAFFRVMGVEVDDVLQRKPTAQQLKLSGKSQLMDEIHSLEMAPISTMISAAKKLNVSLKSLCGAFDLDVAGIPDDCSQSKAKGQPVPLIDRPQLELPAPSGDRHEELEQPVPSGDHSQLEPPVPPEAKS